MAVAVIEGVTGRRTYPGIMTMDRAFISFLNQIRFCRLIQFTKSWNIIPGNGVFEDILFYQ
jgi:hypothetical protein